MAKKATEYPSAMFGTAGRAFHDLENEGVNTRRFLQLIIDHPDFRQLIVDAYREATERFKGPLIDLPDGKIPEGPAGDLAVALFGSQYDNEVYDRYVYTGGLRRLLDTLDARSRGIIILRYGLDDHQPRTLAEIGKVFQVSISRIKVIQDNSLHKLRMAWHREDWSDSGHIFGLELSQRSRVCLMRAGIKTVWLLREKTEDDLLSITSFNAKCLDEVKAKLAERGLSLKDA